MQTKTCPRCKEVLPLDGFYPHPGNRLGVGSHCRECTKRSNTQRYHTKYKHSESYRAYKKQYQVTYHLANQEKRQARQAATRRREREACLAAYGGKCSCCGEPRYEFLSIDHVNGDGQKHRLKVGGNICRHLIKDGFPNDPLLRVLCYNCNMAIAFHGKCPHETERESQPQEQP